MRVRIVEVAEYEYDVAATEPEEAVTAAREMFLSEEHGSRVSRRVGSVERDLIVIDHPDHPGFHEEDFDATKDDA